MSKEGHAVALLSGELEIEQRIHILNRFREGKEKILITTNVLARGIDVEQVTIVVNFDLPIDQSGQADCETYLHRIGRTGRFGKSGLAINLIDGPRSMSVLKQIEGHFSKCSWVSVVESCCNRNFIFNQRDLFLDWTPRMWTSWRKSENNDCIWKIFKIFFVLCLFDVYYNSKIKKNEWERRLNELVYYARVSFFNTALGLRSVFSRIPRIWNTCIRPALGVWRPYFPSYRKVGYQRDRSTASTKLRVHVEKFHGSTYIPVEFNFKPIIIRFMEHTTFWYFF